MGQPLPLPERIPAPNDVQRKQLAIMGINVGSVAQGFASYDLPNGWRMVDKSWRHDIPCWYIVDPDNMARWLIRGSWKETYDNELYLDIVEKPHVIEIPTPVEIQPQTETQPLAKATAG